MKNYLNEHCNLFYRYEDGGIEDMGRVCLKLEENMRRIDR